MAFARRGALIPVLAITACFTGSSPPPSEPIRGNAPLVQGPSAAMCSEDDDLRYPPIDPEPDLRLRNHVTGSLAGAHGRQWNGPPVPDYVARRSDTRELFVLDTADRGLLALYRDPYGVASCGLGDGKNCAYEARFYDARGRERWSVRLDALMSRRDHLEVQDIRFAGGVLYFNEACQSYSSGAKGACSQLVAVDPLQSRVLWRTPHLVSNGRFVVRGCYLVAGYGFTAEPDAMYLVDRGSGRVLQTIAVSSSPQEMRLAGRDQLDVRLYNGPRAQFELVGFDGANGQLRARTMDPSFGGAGYGGASYGGASYGGAGYGGYGRPAVRTRRP